MAAWRKVVVENGVDAACYGRRVALMMAANEQVEGQTDGAARYIHNIVSSH